MEELWKPILESSKYYISNLGRFKNNRGKLLKCNVNARGYSYCNILINGVVKKVKIHRLVAKAFIPNLEKKETVNHKDLNKQNNKAENLEWTTLQENIKHFCLSRSNGTY